MEGEEVLASPHQNGSASAHQNGSSLSTLIDQNGSSPSALIIVGKHTRSDRVMEGEVERASSEKRRTFKRICVFCGSKAGSKSIFSDATVELGKQLVERKIDLVYGGGSNGLMGLISKTVLDGGRHVLGIIPKALMPYEISGSTIGELKIVSSMHERKSEMAKQADAFIALPGGYGTFEELLEMITWNKLGIHDKPVGLLNVDGYFNGLVELFNKGVEEDFIEDSARHIVVVADTAEELMKKMEEYAPVHDGIASKQSWEEDPAPVHDGIASKQSAELEDYAPVHDGIASKQSREEDYEPVHDGIASKQSGQKD